MNTYYVICEEDAGLCLFKVEGPNEDNAINQVIKQRGRWVETIVFSEAPLSSDMVAEIL